MGRLENFKTRGRNIYHIISNKTEYAIKNSKKLEKHHIELGQALDSDNCNPYTATYKVVEELIERNK